MPANLPPVYHEAEQRYRRARSPEEKVACLEEMLRLVPKHKGTEKLQGDLKSRIARLRREPKKKGARGFSHHIPREGAGQIALAGPPNSGKSSLVGRLTHAHPRIGDYPFTTTEALPGMMPFEDIAFQLIDLPPISREHVEAWVFELVRAAELVWLVVDAADSLDGIEQTRELLAERKVVLHPFDRPAPVDLEAGTEPRPGLIVVTGSDREGSDGNVEILQELLAEPWPLLAVSATEGGGLEELGRRTYEALSIIRVYTKQPGRPPDRAQPFTLARGATVAELASRIHKEMAELRFARVWGHGGHDGQSVQRDHVLQEGDVVEIHV